VLYLLLLCTSIGTGGTQPYIMAFDTNQLKLDAHGRQRGTKPKWSFFNLYFFSIEPVKLPSFFCRGRRPVVDLEPTELQWVWRTTVVDAINDVILYFFGFWICNGRRDFRVLISN
jgi:hypothetical protein